MLELESLPECRGIVASAPIAPRVLRVQHETCRLDRGICAALLLQRSDQRGKDPLIPPLAEPDDRLPADILLRIAEPPQQGGTNLLGIRIALGTGNDFSANVLRT